MPTSEPIEVKINHSARLLFLCHAKQPYLELPLKSIGSKRSSLLQFLARAIDI